MTHDDLQAWLDRYVEAWLSYDPVRISDLFSIDAEYRFHPWHQGERVLRGRDAIVAGWLDPELYDAPETVRASYRPFAVDGDRAVAIGSSVYLEGPGGRVADAWDNCYVMRFDDDGRCAEFTEYWVKCPPEAEAG